MALSPNDQPVLRGAGLTETLACSHHGTKLDVVALRLSCCAIFYACRRCHDTLADHAGRPWDLSGPDAPAWTEPVAICGQCREVMTARIYLELAPDQPGCPRCGTPFNPGCAEHHPLYFRR